MLTHSLRTGKWKLLEMKWNRVLGKDGMWKWNEHFQWSTLLSCPQWLRTQAGRFCGTYRTLFGKGTHLFPFDNLIINTWGIAHSGHSDNDHKHVSSLWQRLWTLRSTFPSMFPLNPHTYSGRWRFCVLVTGKETAVNSQTPPASMIPQQLGLLPHPPRLHWLATRAHWWSLHYPSL